MFVNEFTILSAFNFTRHVLCCGVKYLLRVKLLIYYSKPVRLLFTLFQFKKSQIDKSQRNLEI